MRHVSTVGCLLFGCLSVLTSTAVLGCGSSTKDDTQNGSSAGRSTQALTVMPSVAQVRAGRTLQLTASVDGTGVSAGGTWSIPGGINFGSVSASGLYSAPTAPPDQNATVVFSYQGTTRNSQIQILNAEPLLQALSPDASSADHTPITVIGTGFVAGAVILANGSPIATQFHDSSHLTGTVTAGGSTSSTILIQVSNPNPGGITSPSSLPFTFAPAVTVMPSVAQVRAGSTLQLTASVDGTGVSAGGTWSISGGINFGSVSASGLYSAPTAPPDQNATVVFSYQGTTGNSQIQILNAEPLLQALSPDASSADHTPITVIGTGFVAGAVILANGSPIATQFHDSSHLTGTVTAGGSTSSTILIQVSNPNPGGITSPSSLPFTFAPPQVLISPASLAGGVVTISATIAGVGNGSIVELNGSALLTTSVSGNTVTATGYMPPWIQGSVTVSVTSPDGVTELGETLEPVTPTAVSFDSAARLSIQAAWGPRPDIVLHIQQIGVEQFVSEQLAAPAGSYDVTTTNPIRSFFRNVTSGNSLLRLRTAWALQTFIPGQTWFSNHNLALPWEQTLERDAFGNYRQILLDAASDPNITTLLNLPGNVATTDPNSHPNQNFARELMQLFSIGTVELNQDGTPKLRSDGQLIPAYDDATVIDMSRALTGWTYGTPQNSWFTGLFNVDFSVPLTANEWQHDQGSKTLFGTVMIPAKQTAEQDRNAAIEALMNHPNTAPFVSRLLIQRLVKSQPSSAYVQRVASVFANNGLGVSGDLAAVITAILLDQEARSGDTAPDPSDGYLQDPLYQQMFLMSILQISGEDDQSTYIFNNFSETFWNPGTVFGYFPPFYKIPGTSITSPEFQLLTNFTDIQRSQFLYSVVTSQEPGFNNGFTGWLYETFPTVPGMVDALDHLLYHGTMPTAERSAITDYCATVSDPQLKLRSAVFLALNGTSYLVSH